MAEGVRKAVRSPGSAQRVKTSSNWSTQEDRAVVGGAARSAPIDRGVEQRRRRAELVRAGGGRGTRRPGRRRARRAGAPGRVRVAPPSPPAAPRPHGGDQPGAHQRALAAAGRAEHGEEAPLAQSLHQGRSRPPGRRRTPRRPRRRPRARGTGTSRSGLARRRGRCLRSVRARRGATSGSPAPAVRSAKGRRPGTRARGRCAPARPAAGRAARKPGRRRRGRWRRTAPPGPRPEPPRTDQHGAGVRGAEVLARPRVGGHHARLEPRPGEAGGQLPRRAPSSAWWSTRAS